MIALVALGILVHAFYFGKPATTVFDEVHFGKFISAYFTHEYYFDIHPPLGKLILAGWGKLWHFQPGFSFANIGDMYPDKAYLALRFLPSLAGALLPLVIYLLALQLRLTPVTAFGAGILVALDNALLVQSRLILLDSFLLLFGFGAILAYATWRNHIEPRSHMWLFKTIARCL
jgi:dolichyl-phosphate-mannose-protein mannosyltransferase